MSVDNLGLLVYDMIRFEIVEEVRFIDLYTDFHHEFEISNLVPISDTGIRVILADKGSFSIFWNSTYGKVGEPIFKNLTAKNRFINVNGQVTTNLVSYSDLSIVQVIYNINKGGFSDTFLRVYNHMNHHRSKSFKEYNIGNVPPCVFIDFNCPKKRIVAVCGPKYYIFYISTYPSILIDQNSINSTIDLGIFAYNGYSNRTINMFLNTTDEIPWSRWTIFGFFVILIILLMALFR